jgi:hypothetical protein
LDFLGLLDARVFFCTSNFQTPCIYLNKENFRYIMLRRLTQDALENLFSVIRSRCSVPDARDFKCALRMVCLSQFEGKINNSSYAHADTDHLVKYCDSLNSSVSNEDQEDQTDDNHLEISGSSYDESLISDHVKEALYNFLGSLLHKIKKNKKTCDECYNTLIIKDHEEYLGVGSFTRLREYKSNNLCYVNGQIFNYMIECEFAFRSHEELLMKNEVSTKDGVAILLKSKNLPPIPNCHNIMYRVINKKPNQECYLIFCFIETYFHHGSAAFIYLLWTLVLLVAYLSKIIINCLYNFFVIHE